MSDNNIFSANFDADKITIWSSELYRDINSIFTELENDKENIIDEITNNTYMDNDEINECLKEAMAELKKNGVYRNKDHQLYFYVLEQKVWDDYSQKEKDLII